MVGMLDASAALGEERPARIAEVVARATRARIGFSKPRRWNLLSWGIRAVTGSRTSHAWVELHDPLFNLKMVLEAHVSGLRLVPRSLFAATNHVVAYARPEVDLAQGVAAQGRWLGAAYDGKGLLGMSWVILGRWLGKKWKNPVHGSRSLFCSEAVVRMLQAAGYEPARALCPDDTSPEDLLEFLQAHGGDFELEFLDGRAVAQTRRRRVFRRMRRAVRPAVSSADPRCSGSSVGTAP
jgi:hypothetical protein